MKDQKQIIADMKQEGFTFTSLTIALKQARSQMSNTLEALKKQYPGLDKHEQIQNLEAAISNYDALIELYQ